MKKQKMNAYTLAFVGVMAAIIYVVTLFRFPFMGSKVHFANAMCLLGGMFFGPLYGGLAAGLGSALYDAFNGYDVVNVIITFVSKFAMAYVCGKILWQKGERQEGILRVVIAAVVGALTYVALYMLKTFVYQAFVYSFPMQTVWATMLSKFVPSIINAVFAMIAAPILFKAMMPALRKPLRNIS